ncbi:MAG TPA: YCF48-related protein [Gammaproteobacteria bacterium]|nr:YCF48-related protein [Gammaproteobacteria bacterium]
MPPFIYPLFTALLLLLATPVAHGADCETPVPESEWSVIKPLATETLMLDIVRVGETLVVVGERGQVLISEDQGRSWTQQRTPTRALLTGTWFHDRNLGWAVGHDAVILRTEDGGETWCRVHVAPELDLPLFDVWFADAQNGFAIGAYGYFLRSSDGGRTWQEEALEEIEPESSAEDEDADGGDEGWGGDDWLDNITDMHLNRVVLDAAGRLYLVAEAGIVFRSDDQGRTWLRLGTPYDGSFFNGLPPDDDSLLIFGLRGNMFRSWDAGASWRKIRLPVDSSLFGGARLRDGHIIVVGSAGVMLLSDEGDSYRLVQRPDRKALTSAMGTSDGAVIVIGEPGVERIEPGELLAN